MRKFLMGLALLAPATLSAQVPQRGQSGYDTGSVVPCVSLDGASNARCLMPGMILYDPTGAPLGTATNPLVTSSGGTTGGATAANQTATGASSQTVQGNIASGVNEIGNPVKIGGPSATGLPSAVTAGSRVAAWFGTRGQFMIGGTAAAMGDNQISSSAVGTLLSDSDARVGLALVGYNMSAGGVFNTRGDATGTWTTSRGAPNLGTSQVSVGTTATLVSPARLAGGATSPRSRLIITQSAAGPCYYGPTNTVSATTGARLTVAGASKTYNYSGALYGICPGGAVTTDVDEEY